MSAHGTCHFSVHRLYFSPSSTFFSAFSPWSPRATISISWNLKKLIRRFVVLLESHKLLPACYTPVAYSMIGGTSAGRNVVGSLGLQLRMQPMLLRLP
jgi:hypothetical protein